MHLLLMGKPQYAQVLEARKRVLCVCARLAATGRNACDSKVVDLLPAINNDRKLPAVTAI